MVEEMEAYRKLSGNISYECLRQQVSTTGGSG